MNIRIIFSNICFSTALYLAHLNGTDFKIAHEKIKIKSKKIQNEHKVPFNSEDGWNLRDTFTSTKGLCALSRGTNCLAG